MASTVPTALPVRLDAELTPVLAAAGFELVDVELDSVGGQPVLRILVDLAASADSPLGASGRIDLEGVGRATHVIDAHLEATDPIADAFTLEVSSPGLERPLRTPTHFVRFIGTEVAIKTNPGVAGDRRVQGQLTAADSDAMGAITVGFGSATRQIPYADIERARTVFRWGEEESVAPTPSGQPRKKGAVAAGQRKPHPKAQAAAAALAPGARPRSDAALASQTPNDDGISSQSGLSSQPPDTQRGTHTNPEVTS